MNAIEQTEFTQYRRTNIAEMRPYVKGESMDKISVSAVDDPENDMGMVARNPDNHADQWYVARKYFNDNFEPITTLQSIQGEAVAKAITSELLDWTYCGMAHNGRLKDKRAVDQWRALRDALQAYKENTPSDQAG